jgi:hypothetical protein
MLVTPCLFQKIIELWDFYFQTGKSLWAKVFIGFKIRPTAIAGDTVSDSQRLTVHFNNVLCQIKNPDFRDP